MTPPITIRPFDAQTASPELWASFHASRRAIAADLYPEDPVLDDAEIEIEMQRADPFYDCRRWVALSEAEVIGSARVSFRRPETPNASEHAPFLFGGGAVRPEARRRGAGSLLLREIHGLMNTLGKTVLTMSAHTEPGHAFLTQAGAVAKLTTVISRADLSQVDWGHLRQWEDTAEELGLAWECYPGRVPRERLLELLPAFTVLFADVPVGELEVPPVRLEIEGYDQWYEVLDRVKGAHHLIVLLAPGGTVAGLTETMWDSRTPGLVYQQLTAVARAWRGRGVARALKARMLRQVHTCHPEAKIMITGNAETNARILAINVRVGFKVHWRLVEYQVTRSALDQWLATLRPQAEPVEL